MKLSELYQTVTDRIIAELEKGTAPWQKGWNTTSILPANAITGRRYSGINILQLWVASRDRGYQHPEWLTFKQANEVGAKVKKGEKATPVIFVSFEEKEEDGRKVKRPFTKLFYVFNIAQVEGFDKAYPARQPPVGDDRFDAAKSFLANCGVKIEYGGNQACYVPHADVVKLPPYGQFISDERFFSVALHECVHATGHKSRLNRILSTKYRSPEYAAEELIAEIGAAFLMAEHAFDYDRSHADYIGGWLKLLKADNTAIFKAASYASQAAEYLTRQVENALHAVNENTPEVERGLQAAE